MKINWKQKLSSRKFWAAIVGFVTAVLTALNVNNLTVEQVAAIITACGTMMVYILGESIVDANRTPTDDKKEDEE